MIGNPVLLVMSLLAGAQVLAAAANLTDLLGAKPAAWIVLGVAAIQTGVQFWVRGEVTPLANPRDNNGRLLVPVKQSPVR